VSGKALYSAKVSDPSLTPAYEALTVTPWNSGEVSLTWLGGSGQTEDFSLNFKQPLEVKPGFGVQSKYPGVIRLAERRQLEGTIKLSDIDTTDWDAFIAGTTFDATAYYESAAMITGSYPFQMWIDMPECQYTSMKPADLEAGPRREMEFDFAAMYDTTKLHEMKITIVNSSAAYYTAP